MAELGKKASQIWYTQEQYDLVKKAAELRFVAMTTFTINATIIAAAEVVKNHKPHKPHKAARGPKGVNRD